jgi:hypothetical protein
MGPIQVVVQDGNNLVLEVTPTPNTTVILDRGIPGPVGPMGDGDVDGPASSTDNAVARFDGTTGKLIQNSAVTIDDSGNLTYPVGTANGVAYLNASKVLTSGSALTFDGTNLGVNLTNPIDFLGKFGVGGNIAQSLGGLHYFWDPSNTFGWNIGNPGNSLAFSNFGGSEQMRLTSTGLGIGTSSPGDKLEVAGNARVRDTLVMQRSTSSLYLSVLNYGDTLGGTKTDNLSFGLVGGGNILFWTNGTERMRLTDSGNLGIGTSSPSGIGKALNVYGGSGDVSTVIAEGDAGAKFLALYSGSASNDNGAIYSNQSIRFGYATSKAAAGYTNLMTLDTSGNLGLGVTPSAWGGGGSIDGLNNFTWSGYDASIGHNYYYGSGAYRYKASSFGASRYNPYNGAHIWLTAPSGTAGNAISFSQVMTLDASGNLSVGVTTPVINQGRGLTVGSTSGATLSLTTSAASGSSSSPKYMDISFRGYADYEQARIRSWDESESTGWGNLTFWTNDGTTIAEKMRLDRLGNFGLGVTPSAWGTTAGFKAFQLPGGNVNSFDTTWLITAQNAFSNSAGTRTYVNTGFASEYIQTSGEHRWRTAPSGTAGNAITFSQVMTLDASGNVQLGTTNNSGSARRLIIKGSGTADGAIVLKSSSTAEGGNAGFLLQSFGANSEAYVWNFENQPLIFGTNNTERARITSGGFFKATNTGGYVSSTGSSHELRSDVADEYVVRVTNSNASPGAASQALLSFTASAPNNTSAYFLDCTDNTARRAYILSNGGIANYQANDVNLSDRREKTNFAPAKSYLETICAIPVQTFNYIDQNMEDDGGLTLGVVAQDVQAVAPELVMESNWGTEDNPKMRLSIYQTDLQYALMKALQELKAEFDAYKASHP